VKRRLFNLAAAVSLVTLIILILRTTGPTPRLPENTYAGKTEATVRAELGKPDRQFAGHYGHPPIDFRKFTGEIKTLVFKKGGYEHYVSFEKSATGWVGIRSSSVPEGSVF
jgi:hypothetical protein